MNHRVVSEKLHAKELPEAVGNPQTSEPAKPQHLPPSVRAGPHPHPHPPCWPRSGHDIIWLLSALVSLPQFHQAHVISALGAGRGP